MAWVIFFFKFNGVRMAISGPCYIVNNGWNCYYKVTRKPFKIEV